MGRTTRFLLLSLCASGCGSTIDTGNVDSGPTNWDALGGGLTVTPPEITVDLPAGGPAGMATFNATAVVNGGSMDVSGMSDWVLDDTSLGTISQGKFVSNTTKGGTTTVRAAWMNLSGSAILHVKLHASVDGGCPNCPKFPDLPGTPCGAGTDPNLVYPPDGVLIPPNMNVMQVQFVPGTGTKYYEVDFENSATDIRVTTICNPIADTRMAMTGGCSYDLDQNVWDFLATSNKGGDPVTVSVRGTTDGTCATPSNPRNITFAEEDLLGGLYYWQSIVQGGVAGKAGGIFRYDFGARNSTSQPFLTPATGACVGCHFLSRDGQRMTYGSDDADSDDEYNDLSGHLLNVATKALINTSSPGGKPLPPGFQTFTHDHMHLLDSQGSVANAMSILLHDGDTGGAPIGNGAVTNMRGTQPDWSADDKQVVYVQPQKFANQFAPNPYSRPDDDHFLGGSLFTMSWDGTNFGKPAALVTSGGENNYYPSFSPDIPPSFVIFNRVDKQNTDLANDCFNNPAAKVWMLSTKTGSMPLEATRLNGDPNTTNSWPRWSPFVQMYHGQKLLWVTFSSTRDYGVKVRNHNKVDDGNGNIVDQINCFPPDSPQNLNGSHQQPLPGNCNQPQIWMAAINLSQAEFGGGDASYPAFWLPFQEVTAHNHIAQWTETVVPSGGCGDGGSCIADGQPCGQTSCACCGGEVCAPNGNMGNTCQMVIP